MIDSAFNYGSGQFCSHPSTIANRTVTSTHNEISSNSKLILDLNRNSSTENQQIVDYKPIMMMPEGSAGTGGGQQQSQQNNIYKLNMMSPTSSPCRIQTIHQPHQYPPQPSSTGSASPNSNLSASASPTVFPSPSYSSTSSSQNDLTSNSSSTSSSGYTWNTYAGLSSRSQFPYAQYASDYYGNMSMTSAAAAAGAWFSTQDRLYQAWPTAAAAAAASTYGFPNLDDIAFQTQLQRRSIRCTCPNCTNEMSGLPPIVGPDERGRKQHICHIPGCERLYGKASHLKTHLRWHTGERPFLCLTCGKRFSRSDELQRHGRTHTNYRPYSCPICAKKFSRSDHLSKHKKTHFKDKKSKKTTTNNTNTINTANTTTTTAITDKVIQVHGVKKEPLPLNHNHNHHNIHQHQHQQQQQHHDNENSIINTKTSIKTATIQLRNSETVPNNLNKLSDHNDAPRNSTNHMNLSGSSGGGGGGSSTTSGSVDFLHGPQITALTNQMNIFKTEPPSTPSSSSASSSSGSSISSPHHHHTSTDIPSGYTIYPPHPMHHHHHHHHHPGHHHHHHQAQTTPALFTQSHPHHHHHRHHHQQAISLLYNRNDIQQQQQQQQQTTSTTTTKATTSATTLLSANNSTNSIREAGVGAGVGDDGSNNSSNNAGNSICATATIKTTVAISPTTPTITQQTAEHSIGGTSCSSKLQQYPLPSSGTRTSSISATRQGQSSGTILVAPVGLSVVSSNLDTIRSPAGGDDDDIESGIGTNVLDQQQQQHHHIQTHHHHQQQHQPHHFNGITMNTNHLMNNQQQHLQQQHDQQHQTHHHNDTTIHLGNASPPASSSIIGSGSVPSVASGFDPTLHQVTHSPNYHSNYSAIAAHHHHHHQFKCPDYTTPYPDFSQNTMMTGYHHHWPNYHHPQMNY